ncbi:hypothetical protein RCL1_005074 [Eukaryota sp. TZLM3-RCL]
MSKTDDSLLDPFSSIKSVYDERLSALKKLFEDTLTTILKDRFVHQLSKTPQTIPHALERISEIVSESFQSDQEQTITSLLEKISKLKSNQSSSSDFSIVSSSRPPFPESSSLLQDRIAALEREKSESVNHSRSLLKAAQKQISKLESCLDEERKKREEVEKRVEFLQGEKTKFENLQSKFQSLKSVLSNNQSIILNYEKEFKLIQQSKLEIEENSRRKQESFEQILKKSKSRISHLESINNNYKEKCRQFEEEIEEFKRNQSFLKGERDTVINQFNRFKKLKSEEETNISQNSLKLIQELQGQIIELKSQITSSSSADVSVLHESLINLGQKFADSLTRHEHEAIVKTAINETESKCYAIQREAIAKIETTAKGKLKIEKERVVELSGKLEKYQSIFKKFGKIFGSLKNQVEQLKNDHVLLTSSVNTQICDVSQFFEYKVSEFNQKLIKLVDKNLELESENSELTTTIEQLSLSLQSQQENFRRNFDALQKSADIETIISRSQVLDERTEQLRKSKITTVDDL